MRFDVKELKKYYEIGDSEKLISLAYAYQSNVTYVREEDYVELTKLLKYILEKVYDIEEMDVKEAFFDVLKKTININFRKCGYFREVIDLIKEKIESNYISSLDLAESLLIISSTMDKSYSDTMGRYIEHENSYVREIVEEYFADMEMTK